MGTKLGLTFVTIALLAGACGESRLDAFRANAGSAHASDAGPSPPLLPAAYGVCTEGATLTVGSNLLKLEVCADDIIHVVYAPGPSLPAKKSLVVVAGAVPAAPSFQKTDTGDTIVLTTARLRVSVNKTSGAIVYGDSAGNIVLEEPEADGKRITPAIIDGVKTYNLETGFSSPPGEALYGLGEHPSLHTNYKGRDEPDLSQGQATISVPLLVSSRGYGLLWDNDSHMAFSGSEAASTKFRMWMQSGNAIDYYFLYGPELDHVIGNSRLLTGRAPMFPKWAFGLMQSQRDLASQADLLALKDGYRNGAIPLDVLLQDFHYWDPAPMGSHVLDPARYPDPKGMIDQLHAANVHFMIVVWPQFTKGDANYQELAAANAMLAGDNYNAFSDRGRAIFWRQLKDKLLVLGVDSWWLEADAPWTAPPLSTDVGIGKWMDLANAYPLVHTAGVYEGQRATDPAERVFILSRSSFSGVQRNAAAARAGDMPSTADMLAAQVPAGLGFALSGMPYWTTDIGGWEGTDWTAPENRDLFTRWFQFGAFCPLFRIHGRDIERKLYSTKSWDDATRANLLKADQLRYRLVPYLYSNAWRVTNEGYTLMRHLVLDFPADYNVYDISDQFMFGPALLVSPITAVGVTNRTVYLPSGTWIDFWTGNRVTGGRIVSASAPLDKIPLHVRGGSIVPMGPMIQYASASSDPIELRVYPGADGSFTLYDDEGDGYGYETGAYATIPIAWNDAAQTLTVGARTGSFPGMLALRTFNVVLVSPGYGTGLELSGSYQVTIRYDGSVNVVKLDPSWKPN
jgi:alpha-D-xyloside xylohydrolase